MQHCYLNSDDIARKDFNLGAVLGVSFTVDLGAGLTGGLASFLHPVNAFIKICMFFWGGELIASCFIDFNVTIGCPFFLWSLPTVLHSRLPPPAVNRPLGPDVCGVFVL